MLYGKHLGLRGPVLRPARGGRSQGAGAAGGHRGVEARKRCASGSSARTGVYQWFRARAAGEALTLFGADGAAAARFVFPRQAAGERLCLSDYVREDRDDCVALFAVTCGEGVRERAATPRSAATICGPTPCRHWRSRARRPWPNGCTRGCARCGGSPILRAEHRRQAQGSLSRPARVASGYPACPDLADQATLWRLLRPEEVGIALTEGFMMDPEASVSALVFHHPAAKYFKAAD